MVAHLDAHVSARVCARARRRDDDRAGIAVEFATWTGARCASRRGRRHDARDGRLDDDDEARRERLCVLARGTEPARGAAER